MKRWWILMNPIIAGLGGFALASIIPWFQDGRATTVTRLSPDETLRARLVEVSPSWHLDRNFRVQLDFLEQGKTRTIYASPDEGHTVGTERLVWSKDGTKLLLVGRHFFVKADLFLDNGDQLYFLYDVPTAKAWCNADFPSDFAPLTAETIRGIEFTEPIVLKK